MKRILLFMPMLFISLLGLGQSITLDPDDPYNGYFKGTHSLLKLQRTVNSSNSGIEFYNSTGTNQGGLFLRGINSDLNFTTSFGLAGFYINRATVNFGVGTFSPLSKFDVSGDISLSSPNLGFVSRKMQFYSDQGTASEWRPGYVASGDNGSFTGRLDFFTNGTGSGNKLGSVLGMSVVNGRVGIGSSTADSPAFPLHVTSTIGSVSSTTGAFAIGSTTGTHLVFDSDEINAYSNTTGSILYLNPNSNSNVQIGSSAGDLLVTGFTKLGSTAPNIKMKKLTGTTTATVLTTIPHGLTLSKILAFDVLINDGTGLKYPPQEASGSIRSYRVYLSTSDVNLADVSSTLQGEAFTVLITYEE